jgi:Zn-dependent protease
MPLFRGGSLWLFRSFGIDVFVHWSWLLVALLQVQYLAQVAQEGDVWLPLYDSGKWYAIEYLALFAIVLLHEFGHALACRQVGGIADHIVLWPLGGIAFVKAPPRPGALLWTIAAGPLVNLLLVFVLGGLMLLSRSFNWSAFNPDLPLFLTAIFVMNIVLLVLNLLPVYPLDGGQILHALLWFVIGRANSLLAASLIGMMLGGMVMIFSMLKTQLWLFIVATFVFLSANAGFRYSRMLARLLSGPRRQDARCPSCGTSPLIGKYWTCDECGTRFDMFAERGQCPGCGQLYRVTKCPDCFKENAVGDWYVAPKTKDDPYRYAQP